MKEPKTYEQAKKRPSATVWPGCGDGRNRWCGRVHDFQWTHSTGKVVHDFRCWMNHERGCPEPLPIPTADAAKQLWLYWDCGKVMIWASAPEIARRATQSRGKFIRVSHKEHPAPAGYKSKGDLADDPVEIQSA